MKSALRKQQEREAVARFRKRHPERVREQYRRWYEVNRAQELTRLRARKGESYRAAQRKRYRLNNEVYILAGQRRRARQYKAAGAATPAQIRARVAFYGGRCYRCAGAYEALDHVISLSRGGSAWPANLRPICRSCNSSKGAKRLKDLK